MQHRSTGAQDVQDDWTTVGSSTRVCFETMKRGVVDQFRNSKRGLSTALSTREVEKEWTTSKKKKKKK